jgi:hypothetical protein
MKRAFSIILAAAMLLSVVSCTKDLKEGINSLIVRIADLETLILNINESYSNASKVVAALEDHDMIKSITPVKKGENDAYLVSFVSGQTLTLIQGIDGISPNLGIRKYDDGLFYWTVQYGSEEPQWLLSNLGLKIRASAMTPQMKIDDGWWQYSYDGGATWIRLCEATGEPGKSIFKNISISDYFVAFTLSSNQVIQIPTEAYFNRVIEKCNAFSTDLSLASTLLSKVDTTMAVKKISQIMEDNNLVGYTILLNNGKEYNIRTGKDEQPFTFAIKRDHSDWMDYWTVKIGDGDYQWVRKPNGEKALASSLSGTPRLSVRDTLDGLYFVYSFYPDINDYQWLRDANGRLVLAGSSSTNLAFFKKVTVETDNVALTMADGSMIYLPFYYEKNPVISFTPPSGIEYNNQTYLYTGVQANHSYTISFTIENSPSRMQVDAIGMDGAIVKEIVKNIADNTMKGSITFTTPVTFTEATTRILVFLTWGSNVTMKVLEFKNL